MFNSNNIIDLKHCFIIIKILIIVTFDCVQSQYENGITFTGSTAAPTTAAPTTAAPTAAPTTAAPTTAAPTTANPAGCACYTASNCQSLTNGAGQIDLRIVTPTCPTGQIYCCPAGATPTPATPTTAAPTTAAPTTTTAAPTTTTAAPTTTTAAPTTAAPTTTAPTTAAPTTAAPMSVACGVRQNVASTLVQGDGQARYASYPWEAVILTTAFNYIAGAVIVNNRYVLTAAHKVTNYTSNTAGIIVRLGEWDGLRTNEPIPAQDYTISRIAVHPNFNGATAVNDLAVIQLSRAITFTASINTACLPASQTTSYVGQRCWVSGWGKNAFNGQYQAIQKEVQVPIVANAQCQTQLRATKLGQYFILDSSFLCAGGMTNMDACVGDGGSPLVCQGTNGAFTVVGLVSWGIGCGMTNVPGVYTNVAQLLPFINTEIVK